MRELSSTATLLIEYCAADGRVCPRGDKWQELWKMLPEDSTKVGRERMPPPPLILAAASCDPLGDLAKQLMHELSERKIQLEIARQQ